MWHGCECHGCSRFKAVDERIRKNFAEYVVQRYANYGAITKACRKIVAQAFSRFTLDSLLRVKTPEATRQLRSGLMKAAIQRQQPTKFAYRDGCEPLQWTYYDPMFFIN